MQKMLKPACHGWHAIDDAVRREPAILQIAELV